MRQINTAACGAVLLATFVFGAQASLGAVAYVPDNGVALTPYYAIASGQDLGPQSFAGFGFALDYIHVNSNEWNSAGATVALDVSVVVTASGISVFFSATAAASSPGIARGAYEIDFGIRVTNNHALAFDYVVIGASISEFRPSLLPNGALVDDLANATARFASSIAGPYQAGANVDANGNPLLDTYFAEKACSTQDPAQDVGPIFRNTNGGSLQCSVITPDATDGMIYIFDFLPGDSMVLNYSSRLYVEAVRVPAPAGVWVMLLGLAALPPLRRALRQPIAPRQA
jgi:hypothetical protein